MIAFLTILAGLAVVSPASADAHYSDDVVVRVKGNGSLDIIGDNGNNHIILCQDGPGEYSVTIIGNGGAAITESVSGVIRDIRITMRSGDDKVYVNPPAGEEGGCEDFGDGTLTVPGNLRAALGAGDDDFVAHDTSVGGGLFVIGASGDEVVLLHGVDVARVASIRTANGWSDIDVMDSVFWRTIIQGGSSVDDIRVARTDLGSRPRLFTASDDDYVAVVDSGASGRITASLGGGSDLFFWYVSLDCTGPCDPEDGAESFFNVIAGAGDDDVNVNVDFNEQDRFNGGRGFGDRLGAPGEDGDDLGGAIINGFEFFGIAMPPDE